MNSKLQPDRIKQNSKSDSSQIKHDFQNSTKSMESSNYQDFDHIIASNRNDVELLERDIKVLEDLNVDRVMKNNPKKCSNEAYSAALKKYRCGRNGFFVMIFFSILLSLAAAFFLIMLILKLIHRPGADVGAELSCSIVLIFLTVACAFFLLPYEYKDFKAAKASLDEQKAQYKLGLRYDNGDGVVLDKLDGVEF